MPVRYFYIQAVDSTGHNFSTSVGNVFKMAVNKSGGGAKVRAWTEIVDRDDGRYLARIRIFEEVDELTVEIKVGLYRVIGFIKLYAFNVQIQLKVRLIQTHLT